MRKMINDEEVLLHEVGGKVPVKMWQNDNTKGSSRMEERRKEKQLMREEEDRRLIDEINESVKSSDEKAVSKVKTKELNIF